MAANAPVGRGGEETRARPRAPPQVASFTPTQTHTQTNTHTELGAGVQIAEGVLSAGDAFLLALQVQHLLSDFSIALFLFQAWSIMVIVLKLLQSRASTGTPAMNGTANLSFSGYWDTYNIRGREGKEMDNLWQRRAVCCCKGSLEREAWSIIEVI